MKTNKKMTKMEMELRQQREKHNHISQWRQTFCCFCCSCCCSCCCCICCFASYFLYRTSLQPLLEIMLVGNLAFFLWLKYTTKRRQKLHFHLHFMPHFTCFSCFLRPWMKRFASHCCWCCCCCCWRCYLAAHWRRLHQSQNNHGASSSVCRGASCGTTLLCVCVSVCCLGKCAHKGSMLVRL